MMIDRMQLTQRDPAAWIQTYSGHALYVLNPDPELFNLEDIAQGLSHLCRYGGQCRRFYSVAEHSVLLSYAVPSELAQWALMHDASEAYLCDIPKPIKPYIQGYAEIEDDLMYVIAQRFSLSWPMPESLKAFDTGILINEQEVLHPNPPQPWNVPGERISGISITGWSPLQARNKFLSRAFELGVRAI